MGEDGASCFWMYSDASRDLDKAQWDELRFGQVCTQSTNFANFKAEIEKLCRKTRCSVEVKEAFAQFFRRLERVQARQLQLKVSPNE